MRHMLVRRRRRPDARRLAHAWQAYLQRQRDWLGCTRARTGPARRSSVPSTVAAAVKPVQDAPGHVQRLAGRDRAGARAQGPPTRRDTGVNVSPGTTARRRARARRADPAFDEIHGRFSVPISSEGHRAVRDVFRRARASRRWTACLTKRARRGGLLHADDPEDHLAAWARLAARRARARHRRQLPRGDHRRHRGQAREPARSTSATFGYDGVEHGERKGNPTENPERDSGVQRDQPARRARQPPAGRGRRDSGAPRIAGAGRSTGAGSPTNPTFALDPASHG